MIPKAHVAIVLSVLPTGSHVAKMMAHSSAPNGGPVEPMDLFRAWFLFGHSIKERLPLPQRELIEATSDMACLMANALTEEAMADLKAKRKEKRS